MRLCCRSTLWRQVTASTPRGEGREREYDIYIYWTTRSAAILVSWRLVWTRQSACQKNHAGLHNNAQFPHSYLIFYMPVCGCAASPHTCNHFLTSFQNFSLYSYLCIYLYLNKLRKYPTTVCRISFSSQVFTDGSGSLGQLLRRLVLGEHDGTNVAYSEGVILRTHALGVPDMESYGKYPF